MSIQQININIEDPWKYGEVAFLVDRDDFLTDVAMARKLLGIKTLIPNTKFDINKWREEELNEAYDQQLKKNSSALKEKDLLSSIITKSQKVNDKLLKKYHKPLFFSNIIQSAILCGIITDYDFSTTAYARIIDPMDYIKRYKRKQFIGYPKIAIVISPETSLDEISEIYRTKLQSEMDYFKREYLKSMSPSNDTISNIKRDREWYWLNRNGKSALKIWRELNLNIEPKSVENAIRKYKKHLQTPLI